MTMNPQDDAPATKKDVGRLDQKIDDSVDRLDRSIDGVREDVRRVALGYAKMQGTMHDMERRMTERMDANTSKILDVVTSFAAQV
ncbi:hypothetical protein ACFL2T_00015 [Elusimicrobiota bacterium]